MSRYIKVDHSQLDKAADKLEERIRKHNSYMNQADSEVQNLKAYFSGDDYTAYEIQWSKVTDNNSTSKNIIKATQDYADFLRYASSQYKTAQSNAVNRANRIPIW